MIKLKMILFLSLYLSLIVSQDLKENAKVYSINKIT